jgi:hypothetical protein
MTPDLRTPPDEARPGDQILEPSRRALLADLVFDQVLCTLFEDASAGDAERKKATLCYREFLDSPSMSLEAYLAKMMQIVVTPAIECLGKMLERAKKEDAQELFAPIFSVAAQYTSRLAPAMPLLEECLRLTHHVPAAPLSRPIANWLGDGDREKVARLVDSGLVFDAALIAAIRSRFREWRSPQLALRGEALLTEAVLAQESARRVATPRQTTGL